MTGGMRYGADSLPLPDVHLQFLAPVLLAQLAKSFFLDLTNALASQIETLAYFFERQWVLAPDPEIKAGNLRFTVLQQSQRTFNIDFDGLFQKGFVRRNIFVVRKYIQ